MKKRKLLLIISSLFAFSDILSAQTNDPIEPPPPVPIDSCINGALIFALLFAFYITCDFETEKGNL